MKTPASQSTGGKNRGFTLTELLLATAVSGVVLALALTCFVRLQRFHAVCLARSGLRMEVIRLFDAMEMDLRSAKTVSAAVSGSQNTVPLTMTVPQRYTSFEPSGKMSGDPNRSATRIQPTVNTTTGKLGVSSDATIRYEAVANGATAQDIKRTVTWTESGVQRTAARIVSTVPSAATIRFRSSASTTTSPSPMTATDLALIARVNAPLSSAQSAKAAPTIMESTIFLRRKSMK